MKHNSILIFFITSIFFSCNSQNDNKPKDFDLFWKQSLDLLRDVETAYDIIRDSVVGKKQWNLYKIKSFNNISFYAWTAQPQKTGKYPIKIRFSAFSDKRKHIDSIPNSWFLKEENVINMLVDVRGQGWSREEFKGNDFLTNGLNDKNSFVYRGAFLDAVRAVDFISKNPKSDGNIIVTGGSQGGALSIASAALNNKVTMCAIGFPFLSDVHNYNKKKWPLKVFLHYAIRNEIDLQDLKKTLSYFDMIYFSDKINIPIFIRANEIDEVTPLDGIMKFYERLKIDKKEIYIEPCKGHGCSTNSLKANMLEKDFIKENLKTN